jgi:hypothetical protein
VVKQSIDVRIIREAPAKGVEGSVLLDENNNILDLGFPGARIVCMDLNIGKSRSEMHYSKGCCEYERRHSASTDEAAVLSGGVVS